MNLTASDIYSLHSPSKCPGRVYYRQHGYEEAAPGPFEQVIFRLAERHEREHLGTFPHAVDLSEGPISERSRRTLDAINQGSQVIYQGVLIADTELVGIPVRILGIPDFLIHKDDGYIVRDSKLAQRIDAHREISLQLQLLGWLLEQTSGKPPISLEVHNGANEILPITYDGGESALAEMTQILQMKMATEAPYTPVGWSKCGGCGFMDHCWTEAEACKDVALLVGIDQGLAVELRNRGIVTYHDLLKRFDAETLSDISRPWGQRYQRVGKKSESILRMAEAMVTGREIYLDSPRIPRSANYVMFDLEGLPPYCDELEKIYLWGTQVYGEQPGEFTPAVAGFGEGGDEQGWRDFLRNARAIFDEYGDIPYVHWASYEKTKISLYIERYGDPEGIAQRVLDNLLDLLPITRNSVALPLPSYSLKVIEKHVGFQRTMDEFGGDWSIARYIEAVETEDETLRKDVMDEILQYNQEDLEATWAVFQWLRSKMD